MILSVQSPVMASFFGSFQFATAAARPLLVISSATIMVEMGVIFAIIVWSGTKYLQKKFDGNEHQAMTCADSSSLQWQAIHRKRCSAVL